MSHPSRNLVFWNDAKKSHKLEIDCRVRRMRRPKANLWCPSCEDEVSFRFSRYRFVGNGRRIRIMVCKTCGTEMERES